MWRPAVVLACCAGAPGTTRADPGALLTDDTWSYRSTGDLAVDGGLVVGFPSALPTGLAHICDIRGIEVIEAMPKSSAASAST